MIKESINNKIAILSLDRPDVFNSFNREMALLFQKKLDACEKNPNPTKCTGKNTKNNRKEIRAFKQNLG